MSEPRRHADDSRDELVRRYQRRVYAVIHRMTGRHADADDLCQETFLQVFRGVGRLPPGSNLDSWVYRVAMNVSVDHLRRQGRERALKTELERQASPPSPTTAPDTDVEAAVRRALDQIPADQKAVLVLRSFEGMSYQEIASIQGIPVGTARWRFFAARRALEKLLGAYL
ncbi:sigma-70 family RNA polymerase sigma factor [bacterium]|nr:sigma-70 family RNA polymerase sigma factor [bacterium]